MKRHWYYWLLLPFTLPNILVSLALALPYGVAAWRWKDGCLELVAKRTKDDKTRIWGRPGAQCLGCPVIWYASKRQWRRSGLRVHERVHVIHGLLVQALAAVLVPLMHTVGVDLHWAAWWPMYLVSLAPFGVAYGGHFLWEWTAIAFASWKTAYYRIWSERIAYRIQDEYDAGARPDAWGGNG